MTTPNSEYAEKELSKYIGWTITGTVIDGDYYGIYVSDGVAMLGNDTDIIWFLRDEEGNGPGAFQIQQHHKYSKKED